MLLNDIINVIEEKIPLSLAYDWDNPGFLLGNKNKDIKKILICLDVNLFTVKEAVKNNADLIISHHPMFFNPVKNIDYSTTNGQIIKLLIENDVCVYAAHTNMDIADGGINDKLCDILSLSDVKVLENDGLGRVGYLKNEMNFSDFCKYVSDKLDTPLRFGGDNNKTVNKVAVGSGSCMDIANSALKENCDVFITADVKYHEMLDYTEAGLNIIDAGHYPTEICVMDIFEDILKNYDTEIIKSTQKDVFKFIN